MTRLYRRFMNAILHSLRVALGLSGDGTVLLLGSMALVYIEFVKVKMLPFDNKSEFQVIVDMPEGTTLEADGAGHRRAGRGRSRSSRRWSIVQTYVRHRLAVQLQWPGAALLPAPRLNVADIQVNLFGKHERDAEPRDRQAGASSACCRWPPGSAPASRWPRCRPGPPVLQTLVAEVYGPTQRRPDRASRARSATSWRRPTASSTSTGMSRRRQPKYTHPGGPGKSRAPRHLDAGHRRSTLRLASAGESGRPAARRRGKGRRAHHAAARPRHALRPRAAQSLKVWAGLRGAAWWRCANWCSVESSHRGQEHLPQEPDAGHLRDRRRRRRDGEPGLRHSEAGPGDRRMKIPEGYAIEQHTASQPLATRVTP